jgi:hypothetical protein
LIQLTEAAPADAPAIAVLLAWDGPALGATPLPTKIFYRQASGPAVNPGTAAADGYED